MVLSREQQMRGFNVPWVIFGMGLAWLVRDAVDGKVLLAFLDLPIIAAGYFMAERRT
jgi:hypothetical protein